MTTVTVTTAIPLALALDTYLAEIYLGWTVRAVAATTATATATATIDTLRRQTVLAFHCTRHCHLLPAKPTDVP